MPVLTFNGNSHTVDHAVKGPDYVHGYDVNGVCVISIDGVTDFSGIKYNGVYMDPEDCVTESCNDLKLYSGKIQTADGRPVTPKAIDALSMELLWENGNTASNFGSQTVQTADVGHNFVLLECRVSTSSSTYVTSNLLPANNRTYPVDYVTNAGKLQRRRTRPSTNGVYFETAELSGTDDNSLMIPTRIFAVKGAI